MSRRNFGFNWILEFERQLDRATAYLQAIQDSIKALPRELVASSSMAEDNTVLRVGSLLSRAQEAIQNNCTPMHVNAILSALGMQVSKNTRVSLVGSTGTYVREGIIFTRPGPNIFGLFGMGSTFTKATGIELPNNFGEVEET